MLQMIRWIAWTTLRFVLSLRYRLRFKGLDEVLKRPGPYLILPNHPAYADPPNIIMRLWPSFKMRPLFLETNFHNPVLAPFALLLRGIRVPDTAKASAEARVRAEAAANAVVEALGNNENIIVWPSGRLSRDGREHLGGARTVADVLAAFPNVTVVLARTRGLWGSITSYAPTTERQMNLGKVLMRAFLLWLSNLFLFAPRRNVTVTLEAFGPKDRPEPTREAVNRWLESWYNADLPDGEPEKPTFVPHHFLFGPRTFEFPPRPPEAEVDLSKVKQETKQAVAHFIEEKLKRPLDDDENAAAVTFAKLGLDSLDAMEVSLEVERRFGFTGESVPTSIGQLWALAEGIAEKAPPKPPPTGWFVAPSDLSPLGIDGVTIPAAILNRAFKQTRDMLLADDMAGGVIYEKVIVGAWAMSGRFRDLDAPNVGLMMPASVAGDLALFGLFLAGKLPVLLNWTTGPANLTHAAKIMGLTHVVTSKAFIDRVQVQVPGTQFLFLEDVKANLGKVSLLRRLLAVRFFPNATKNRLLGRLSNDPDAPAVILFTSGSEKAPKAVPLTHANILHNHRAAVAALKLTRQNSIIGFLPMFHSFGMTVTTLLPLTNGVKVVHHPDPTDAGALVRKIAVYKPTLIAGTPTFIGYILDRAKPGDLDSLRLIVVGAEKPPPSLFDRVKEIAPAADVIEAYGITECSPGIALTLPGADMHGTVGLPLPEVEVCVTDLETGEPLPHGSAGMLNVHGPNVFPGYIAHDGPSPFRDIDGKRWYVTGDLGKIDATTGVISFNGRLKRFLKAGGEMISLPALEEPFTRKFPPTDKGPRAAVEGIETPTGRRIVLFTTDDIALREANAVLQAEGFRGVMRLDDVRKLETLPVLGTGKTDYKVLRAMIDGVS